MRVLVVQSGLILTAGIEGILAQESDLSVKGIRSNNRSTIAKEITVFQPNVVILEESPDHGDRSEWLDLMDGYPDLSLMVVNTRDNRILVYQKQEIEVTQVADLATVIRSRRLTSQLEKLASDFRTSDE